MPPKCTSGDVLPPPVAGEATASPPIEERHLLVSGKVQGVFYRKYTQRVGSALGLTGWVRNLPNGEVEILAEGTATELDAIQRWCYTGSPKSKVTAVNLVPSTRTDGTRKYQSFDVLR